ncbi:Lrp/AsnC family transcriptional regulator [Aminobacter aminovorans]|uniref:Lrp/AsnC family transcriptional regulator n=1 Tax=Aminobacter TaxID=31988 RepID=UPI00285C65CC|nr:Lrp/AsnC family transcriptional regulator [Aminobacter aminovorans]MDR7220830.1 DNA-binding Lrp family transcriptional regulator [Aminobacter aminovorans]
MGEETDAIRQNRLPERSIDAADRRLLGALVEDATVSYAELGEKAGMSAPAAHERVKRMRRSGAIRQTVAMADPRSVGKPLLAFVHVDTRGWGKTPELMAVSSFPEVEEIHTVAGDACILLKVRTEDTRALEGLLARIYDTPGVTSTRSYVVLSTYLERPVQPGITQDWPAPKLGTNPIY